MRKIPGIKARIQRARELSQTTGGDNLGVLQSLPPEELDRLEVIGRELMGKKNKKGKKRVRGVRGNMCGAYFSPGRGADEVVIGFIDRCNETCDIAAYSLTHDPIRDAIIRAHNRGVAVRVLMDNLQARSRYADDEALMAAGVPTLVDKSSSAMHHKFIIGDGTAIMTGSFNFTKNAVERNAENFVIVRLKYIIREFQKEFEYQWELNTPSE